MHHIEKEIDLRIPVATAYEQWRRFEEFPRFMQGVKEVRRLGHNRLFWRAEILGQDVEWEAVITNEIPPRRIAWQSVTGHPNRGAVEFTPAEPSGCRVKLALDYQPLGVAEEIGDALGLLSLRVHGDLDRFRDYMETPRSGQIAAD
jgi:uncharacterized membrane protein